MFNKLKIGTKLGLIVLVVGLTGGIVFLISGYQNTTSAIEIGKANIDENTLNSYSIILDRDSAMLSSNLITLSNLERAKAAYKNNDRTALYDIVAPIFKENKDKFGITHMYFIDLDGKVFLRAHDKNNFGDLINRQTFVKAKDTGKIATGLELGKTAFALRAVMPYRDNGKIIGYIELGEEIDHFIDILSEKSGNEYVVIGKKDTLVKTDWYKSMLGSGLYWDEIDKYVIITKQHISNSLSPCINNKLIKIDDSAINYKDFAYKGNNYYCSIFAIKDARGEVQGGIISSNKITNLININNNLNKMVAFYALCITLLTISSLLLAIRLIVYKPVKSAIHTFERIKNGDLNEKIKIYSDDEIGQMARSFNDLTEKLNQDHKKLEQKVEARTKELVDNNNKLLNSEKGLKKNLDLSDRVNRLMIGREIEMKKLKQEIKDLTEKLNGK